MGPNIYYQITESERSTLEALLFMPEEVQVTDLSIAWRMIWPGRFGTAENRIFFDALKTLDGTMIRSAGPSRSILSFQNPSVADFMIHHLNQNPQLAIGVLSNAAFFEQIERSWTLATRSPAIMALDGFKDTLQQATLRTLDSPPIAGLRLSEDRPAIDIVHRLNVALRIAAEIGSLRLAQRVYSTLRYNNIDYDSCSLDEAAELILRCHSSEHDGLRSASLILGRNLAIYLTHDMREWASVDTAFRLLQALRDLPLEAYLSEAERTREEVARRTIEQLANRGQGATREVDMSTLYEVLDYANQWDDARAFAPHLPEVWESIELVQQEDELLEYLAESADEFRPSLLRSEEIALMFSLLTASSD